jgi:hypothetical protein
VGHHRGVDDLCDRVADVAGQAAQELLGPLLAVADHRRCHEVGQEQIVPGGDVIARNATERAVGVAGVKSTGRIKELYDQHG